jgi:uncharacterized membrane protein YGL010W
MNEVFWRQFAAYADYHRDKRNCAMHIIGTPLLFLAAVLPFSLLSVTVWGMSTNAAALLVIPALIFWMLLDLAIGAAIACAVIPLLITAAITVKLVGVAWVWATIAMLIVIGWSLQIVGHSFFERRRPALLDNPLHMLMSPMFIVAKLFVTLGFRRDLAAVLSEQASDKAPDTVATGGNADACYGRQWVYRAALGGSSSSAGAPCAHPRSPSADVRPGGSAIS